MWSLPKISSTHQPSLPSQSQITKNSQWYFSKVCPHMLYNFNPKWKEICVRNSVEQDGMSWFPLSKCKYWTRHRCIQTKGKDVSAYETVDLYHLYTRHSEDHINIGLLLTKKKSISTLKCAILWLGSVTGEIHMMETQSFRKQDVITENWHKCEKRSDRAYDSSTLCTVVQYLLKP